MSTMHGIVRRRYAPRSWPNQSTVCRNRSIDALAFPPLPKQRRWRQRGSRSSSARGARRARRRSSCCTASRRRHSAGGGSGPALAAAGFRVHAPDMPGHGHTGSWRGHWRFHDNARDLVALVEALRHLAGRAAPRRPLVGSRDRGGIPRRRSGAGETRRRRSAGPAAGRHGGDDPGSDRAPVRHRRRSPGRDGCREPDVGVRRRRGQGRGAHPVRRRRRCATCSSSTATGMAATRTWRTRPRRASIAG